MAYELFAAVLICGFTNVALAQDDGSIASVDHIPIAVKDLQAAGQHYRELGFTLKPGQVHDNSIDNLHAKNSNATELELITATEPGDDLAKKYLAYIYAGDGPAFLALRANFDELEPRLKAANIPYERRGSYLLKATDPALHYLFFVQGNDSPTDKPEHFAHANTSTNLVAVWIADAENPKLVELLGALGASFSEQPMPLPGAAPAQVAKLRDSEIRLLPKSSRLIWDRPIVGATLEAADVKKFAATLHSDKWLRADRPGSLGIVLQPSYTHGLWLEFRSKGDSK